MVRSVAGMNGLILTSFEKQKGQELEIEFKSGKIEKLKVAGVEGGKVKTRKELAGGYAERVFGVGDLSVGERTKRIGLEKTPGVCVMRGLLLLESGNAGGAEASFNEAGEGLGAALAKGVKLRVAQMKEVQARQAYLGLLLAAGISGQGQDPNKLAETIAAKQWSKTQAEQLAKGASIFRVRYGESQIAKTNDIVLVAFEGLGGAGGTVPAAPKSDARGSAPPKSDAGGLALSKSDVGGSTPSTVAKRDPKSGTAEKDARLALTELLKLAGVGTDLEKSRELLRQIAGKGYQRRDAQKIKEAVEAFEKDYGTTEFAQSQWRVLDFMKQVSPEPRPALVQATEENLKRAVEDLKRDNPGGDPIPKDGCGMEGGMFKIEGLAPHVKNLRALDCLPLVKFGALNRVMLTQICDISVLTNCPLKQLNIQGAAIEDFSPIGKMTNLRYLGLKSTLIKDLGVLRGLKLVNLDISGTEVKDLSPLKGMNLDTIQISRTKVKDLSPLAGMPILILRAEGSEVTDLSPLAAVPLGRLVAIGTPGKSIDLTPLAGKKIGELTLCGGIVSFLPLKDMSVHHLYLDSGWENTKEAGNLPKYLPALENISMPSPSKQAIEIILRFRNLKTINGLSPDEFRKKYGPKAQEEKKSK